VIVEAQCQPRGPPPLLFRPRRFLSRGGACAKAVEATPQRSRRRVSFDPRAVLARPFAPDTGTRQDPRRNHGQGN